MTKHRRHSRKRTRRSSRRRRHTYKHIGGACFGNGVGSNHVDPNYSIYNTRALQLFPYRAT